MSRWDRRTRSITVCTTPPARADELRFLGHAHGTASYRLASGTYRLTSRLR
ncbi:hypothetical protein [Streptomyces sp. SAS_270]|uniref:hypothetical protein n=1 Tax=Streptomyces sp. SAS_270 TaxID=3412748 RepID=UPI00403CC1F1